ncbi:hypothetical protein NF212_18705 [Parasalinivibrio latis]|uniref:hypothetical protein n=1 Tax=Parasalinivibrio latis TaxID=2952610 RepID=UPI0030E39F3E
MAINRNTVGFVIVMLLTCSAKASATEQVLSGLLDTRSIYNQSSSYVDGTDGKFRFQPHASVALAQLGLVYQLNWDNPFSLHLTANGYIDGVKDKLGVTEGYLNYSGLPSEKGFRISGRAGFYYPDITFENFATAWSSPYTLSYSTINSWLAEETRHAGLRLSLSRLGKFYRSPHDYKLSMDAFWANDTSGAMLAWHGWTLSSRQSLLGESLPLLLTPALQPGGALQTQSRNSKPFIELDNQPGISITGSWRWQGHGEIKAGYYDNRADTRIVSNGQYAWRTQFSHLGGKWRLPGKIQLIAQYMKGKTLMTSPNLVPMVDLDFEAGSVLLNHRRNVHSFSIRGEAFDITDKDNVPGDNNSESGYSLTFSWAYNISKGWYAHIEHNRINSQREARRYFNNSRSSQEWQWQIATRYFF